MNCFFRRASFLCSILAALAVVFCSGAAHAAIRIFPGAAPCNSTLQACIDSAKSGDVIQTNTGGFVDEDLNIQKSITLMPAPGKDALYIGGGATVRTINIREPNDQSTIHVSLIDIDLEPGAINISFDFGSGHTVDIRKCEIFSQSYGQGIYVSTFVSASVRIESCVVATDGYPIEFFSAAGASDTVYFSAVGNRVTGQNSTNSYAGFDIDLRGAGTAQADILSNIIWGVAWCNCGNPTGIGIYHSDSVNTIVNVANNTIDHSGGMGISDLFSGATGIHEASIYNNIITNCVGEGIYLPAADPSVFIENDYNDFFGNGPNVFGGYPPGSHTYSFDPLNAPVGFGYYALKPNSPAIDAGYAAAPSGISVYDGWMKPRIFGANVDLGAIESSVVSSVDHLLYSEDFGDSNPPPSIYTYPKGTWMGISYYLIGFSDRKAAFLASPAFAGCGICKIDTPIMTSGDESGATSKIWIQGWYADKNNDVELIVKQGSNKMILRQKVNGTVVNKTKATVALEPFTEYKAQLAYDGSTFQVYVDGQKVITMPAIGSPFGTLGFQVKGTQGYLGGMYIHN